MTAVFHKPESLGFFKPKQEQISSMSFKFRSCKEKVNRITGAELFTFNESDFFFFNYSITI